MKILGKSRVVATLLAAAAGLAVASSSVSASAQLAPTGVQNTPTPPKPGAPTPPAPGAKPAPPAKPADPKALLVSGEKKLKANDFAGALADFEASNSAKASPEADRFIGQSHDNLGHFAEAVIAYERFLAHVPAAMKAQGDDTKKRVEAIKAMPGKVHVETTPPGAHITVDAAASTTPPANPTTTPADLDLAAGHHTLKIVAEGYAPVDKEIDVTYGSKQDVRLELAKNEPPPPPPVAEVPVPAPAPPPPPPPEPRSKVPAYVTGGVAIIAAGVGTAFGIKALGQSSDFKDSPTTKRADDGENNALVADMMFGIAITFGVTSAVLFLSGNDAPPAAAAKNARPVVAAKKPPRVTFTPTPYVTPSGGGAGALLRF